MTQVTRVGSEWYLIGYHARVEASELVRQLRVNSGLSQRALAERAGTSHSTIAAYEAGKKCPSLATLARIAAAAGQRVTAEIIANPQMPMALSDFARAIANDTETDRRWLLLLEFVEGYEHAAAPVRERLLSENPRPVALGWDALIGAVADWLAKRDGIDAPEWVEDDIRFVPDPWSPYNDAVTDFAARHAPEVIRRHGVILDPYDLGRA